VSAQDCVWLWRHPRAEGAAGRCIGCGTDLPVHWRRAKRLARRVQAHARRERLPHRVWTSPLQRCADVGRWLRRWGWSHVQLEALREIDFGHWDGRTWDQIGRVEVDAWCADFAHHAPGGGESLQALLARVCTLHLPARALVVAHGGTMVALRWASEQRAAPPSDPLAWPRAPRNGQCWKITLPTALQP